MQWFKKNKYDDSKHTWLCLNRLTDDCKKNHVCRGTECRNFDCREDAAIDKQYLKFKQGVK